MIILIDGPEKAGKSTIINKLSLILNAKVRHWGPVDPDDRVYTAPLIEDAKSNEWVIWDRGWPSEHIYGKLLNRDRRLSKDDFLGEWLHGRAVQTRGLRYIILPENYRHLYSLRNTTDLPVRPVDEYLEYKFYAQKFGYNVLLNDYDQRSLERNVHTIVGQANKQMEQVLNLGVTPPYYAGPIDANVIFVGETRNVNGDEPVFPGGILPFSSPLTTTLGRRLGNIALRMGWTNIDGVPTQFLEDKLVVACGHAADTWTSMFSQTRIVLPHPAWLYRYNNSTTQQKRMLTENILTMIGDYNEQQARKTRHV